MAPAMNQSVRPRSGLVNRASAARPADAPAVISSAPVPGQPPGGAMLARNRCAARMARVLPSGQAAKASVVPYPKTAATATGSQ